MTGVHCLSLVERWSDVARMEVQASLESDKNVPAVKHDDKDIRLLCTLCLEQNELTCLSIDVRKNADVAL